MGVWGFGGLGVWAWGFGFRVSGFGFRVSGLGFRVWGLGFGVWGSGVMERVEGAKDGERRIRHVFDTMQPL